MSIVETPVGQLVAERPSRSRVFERWGLDYCCGGKKPLNRACSEKQVDIDAVVRDLLDADKTAAATETTWTDASLASLCDHIVDTHHAYLREALPRLATLIEKVALAHGAQRPQLALLEQVFRAFRAELELHMMKEEQILFPFIKHLEGSGEPPSMFCGSVHNPIRVMEHEHDSAGAALAEIRVLTDDFQPPAGACNTYLAMLDGLAELEADMHKHVHLENNILFPRATTLETQLVNPQGCTIGG
jgi:regulator of cell morphogenesis and NO signaling